MKFPHVIHTQLSGLLGCCVGGGRDEVTHLGELVYYHKDSIMAPLCDGHLSDEIHGDCVSRDEW